MPDHSITFQLEIPPEVAQQDVWDLEEQLGHIAGITTELQQPRDLVAATLLFINVVGPYALQTIAVAGGINTLHDLARNIYGFLHPKKQEAEQQRGKNKVVIIMKRKRIERIELYDLSLEEIEKIIAQ